MKVWISKYAISSGIFEVDVEQGLTSDEIVCWRRLGSFPAEYFHAGDWHKTRKAAVAKAELMREKKIVSLTKQLAKLEAMKF